MQKLEGTVTRGQRFTSQVLGLAPTFQDNHWVMPPATDRAAIHFAYISLHGRKLRV